MSTDKSWTRPRPDTPFPKRFADIQTTLPSASPPPRHQPDPLLPLPAPHTDSDSDADPSVPESGEVEEDHTLSGYGDIPFSDVILPSSSTSLGPSPSSLQLRFPPPRPRLRLRRPRPRRRTSYTYVRDPLPLTKGLDHGDPSPGSPRFPNHRHQHQPLVSPLHNPPPGSRISNENMPVDNNDSSVERLVNELLPSSPSIRLSPPGSPKLSQESRDQKDGAQKLLSPSPAPASTPRQNKPKPAPWRTRLPPRPPIPKWDI
ncbi:hypothetical protein JVU11DRAFT_7510 [Chiua virens]|nr:hypothetical protein JVU11DRAFT_7510 [Chiua virens]